MGISKSKREISGTSNKITDVNASQQHLTYVLRERLKELNCLYGISSLVEKSELSIDNILQEVVSLIPPAWQYPEITCARIKLKNEEFSTPIFKETNWKQSKNIMIKGKKYGVIEICYRKEKPACDDGPFLAEERSLLNVIAERLGHIIEHKMDAADLQTMYERERKLRKKLQSEIRIRVDFTRKLIHELKTPLTSLMATSQLLHDETKENNLGRLTTIIRDCVSNLNTRIEELHDVTRGELGKLKVTREPVNLEQLLQKISEETKALTDQYGITLELQTEKNLPIIQVDPDRIRQIILNLINNACKYAKNGHKVTIISSRKENNILIEVRDYGHGISIARQKTLFEPGYQLIYHEERSGGLGIGLALCKMLVELHDGQIWIKSRLGKGTSIFIMLPIRRSIRSRGSEQHESSDY